MNRRRCLGISIASLVGATQPAARAARSWRDANEVVVSTPSDLTPFLLDAIVTPLFKRINFGRPYRGDSFSTGVQRQGQIQFVFGSTRHLAALLSSKSWSGLAVIGSVGASIKRRNGNDQVQDQPKKPELLAYKSRLNQLRLASGASVDAGQVLAISDVNKYSETFGVGVVSRDPAYDSNAIRDEVAPALQALLRESQTRDMFRKFGWAVVVGDPKQYVGRIQTEANSDANACMKKSTCESDKECPRPCPAS